jgi:Transglutaminase-like superfamily
MLSVLGRVRRLPWNDCQLLLTVGSLAVAVAVLLRVAGLARWRTHLHRLRRIGLLRPADDRRVVWALNAIGHRLPFASNCLVRALVAETLVSADGGALHLAIGIRRENGRLMGHAWLERDGAVIVGASDAGECPYTPMIRWDCAG